MTDPGIVWAIAAWALFAIFASKGDPEVALFSLCGVALVASC